MSTIFTLLAILLACLIVVGGFIAYRMRHRFFSAPPLPVSQSLPRRLTEDERIAIERYLAQENSQQTTPLDTPNEQPKLPRSLQSNRVYPITHTITRYGLSTDTQNKWRYYIDTQEVHLPPSWEPFITENNTVELIKTRSIPLVISLNGHSLTECLDDRPLAPLPSEVPVPNASIRQEGSEHAELVTIRKETREEHAMHHSGGLKETAVLCVSFLLLFISLNSPIALLPWLIGTASLLAGWSLWQLFRSPSAQELRDVHCLHGTPQGLGLFGESNQGPLGNISLGNIDLIYPPHWQPYITQDLGRKTDVDIYLNRQVIRQGEHLSLHDEVKHFPLQRWGRNLLLAAGSLLSLILLVTNVQLELPLKLSLAWLQGAQRIQVTQVSDLETTQLRIGDTLAVRGNGMCYVPAGIHPVSAPSSYAFSPFDCSAIYWNKAAPLPLPESETIEKASALLKSVNSQLHPQAEKEGQVNSQLASTIQKSGLILMKNFAEVVLRTQDLCRQENDCSRLKNALVNLSDVKNWNTLVKDANSGTLKGMNVVLPAVSAETLESLVNSSTDQFFYQEINNAADSLNSPPPGGFLIRSDEGRQFVNHPLPPMPLNEYRPSDQWQELQRLSAMLLHTPFNATGVITQLNTDANGTQHISLHSEPDVITVWRYLGTCLLLLLFSATFIVNAVLTGIKMRKSQKRVTDIQRYYASRFNMMTNSFPDNRPQLPR
ncbi:intracellular growth attenuator family protein [Pectobacterium brasiliense]|uniref:intracellular growth attenuator family protein n=1 Tax=Pectobacterium brasiliense TaxID=180957 RepID=UPI00057D824E|nr:intracellular growth attenuator family protein [Pectobacterium brasiliense]KHT01272.1 Intracellular growth attenuator protein igaA [Pectobacterium brasiliense]MBN3098793.1 intracellular growth attenuator family protein [Pectobacterium brasiliense]MBN3100678.1 intracellular growth attenuator family protein [Pectobacterium brasiliense]MBN3113582.1 intracellular growth attenuator family protein [Pectobacterium brasiliense]MBN3166947.1 intracellular growth attenuator family protein [Pectobacter